MSWWEYIPGVNAVGHALTTYPGEAIEDYKSCQCTPPECEAGSADPALMLAAQKRCADCMFDLFEKYLVSLIPGMAFDVGIGAVGYSLTKDAVEKAVINALKKYALTKGVEISAEALSGIGTILAVGDAADFVVLGYKLIRIIQAYFNAKEKYCVCH
jgi:hypothetical protein